MPKMQRMTAKECIRLIEADGWFEVSQNNGNHRKFRHPLKLGIVVIPVHSKDIPTGTLAKILKQAGLK